MTIGVAIFLIAVIFIFARTVPARQAPAQEMNTTTQGELSTDTMLQIAKQQLTVEQSSHVTALENRISRGAVKDQQIEVYHQLAHFWGDSLGFFPPYAWYQAEAARLENSEKSLTFAAHLLLSSLEDDHNSDQALMRWKALQAKDLFERSLRINPDNDSSKVGLGACYLFGSISQTPMEGINMIREVTERDSTNIFALMMMAKGAFISGQFDKATGRLKTVCRLQPDNIEAILLLADVYERTGDKPGAAEWYKKSLLYVKQPEARTAIEKRIADLMK